MNRISTNSHHSENDFESSANEDLSNSQNTADVIAPNLDPSAESAQSKTEERESCDKCGRSEIPIQIKYESRESTASPKSKNKYEKRLTQEGDDLKIRMEYFDIRLGCIEKALFSKKD